MLSHDTLNLEYVFFDKMKLFQMSDEAPGNLLVLSGLTHKQLETHVCLISTVATAALVLKHQAISSRSADCILIDQFHTTILYLLWKTSENKITFWWKNIYTQLFKVLAPCITLVPT